MDTTTGRRVELYVRSLASRTGEGPQERAIDRLRRFDAEGTVDSFGVRVWGDRVGLSTTAVDTPRGEDILGRIGTFRAWATRNGVSLDTLFEARETTSRITGEEYAILRLPVLLMAEYAGSDLDHVSPHERDGTVRTVDDRLDALGDTSSERHRLRVRP